MIEVLQIALAAAYLYVGYRVFNSGWASELLHKVGIDNTTILGTILKLVVNCVGVSGVLLIGLFIITLLVGILALLRYAAFYWFGV